MTTALTTVWPNDVVSDAQELHRDSPHNLVCFLICPFKPHHESAQVLAAVKIACDMCSRMMGTPIEVKRADSFSESKVIHDDIWRHIAKADVLVVDVTGQNANVMYEYGMAAAVRRPAQVIAIKSKDDELSHPFDVGPLRYLSYERSIIGAQEFLKNLYESMLQALTPAPYVPPLVNANAAGFRTIDLRDNDRPDLILSPGITHRRIMEDGLEFGSFYVFRHSWFILTGSDYHNVRARVKFRFQDLWKDGMKEPDTPFLCLALRSQHVFANWGGYIVAVGSNGKVWRTEPHNELGKYDDVTVGHLDAFDWQKAELVDLEVEIDDRHLSFKVGNVRHEVLVKDMPYVYGAGKVRVTTSRCRVLIRELELTPLHSTRPLSNRSRRSKEKDT
jgi:hypothetical protein